MLPYPSSRTNHHSVLVRAASWGLYSWCCVLSVCHEMEGSSRPRSSSSSLASARNALSFRVSTLAPKAPISIKRWTSLSPSLQFGWPERWSRTKKRNCSGSNCSAILKYSIILPIARPPLFSLLARCAYRKRALSPRSALWSFSDGLLRSPTPRYGRLWPWLVRRGPWSFSFEIYLRFSRHRIILHYNYVFLNR